MRKIFWKGVFWLIEPMLDQLDARKLAEAQKRHAATQLKASGN